MTDAPKTSSPLLILPGDADWRHDPLATSVRRRPMLDLARYTRAQYRGAGCVWYLTWTLDDERPALAILPERWPSGRRPVPCVIRLDSAWRWDETRGDPQYIIDRLHDWQDVLPIGETRRGVFRFLSALREVLGDLIAMPPMPRPDAPFHLGEAVIREAESGEVIEERDLTLDV